MSKKQREPTIGSTIAFRLDANQTAQLDAELSDLNLPSALGLSRSEKARYLLLDYCGTRTTPAKKGRP